MHRLGITLFYHSCYSVVHYNDSRKAAMAPLAISIGVWQMYTRIGNAAFAAFGMLLFLCILCSIWGYFIGKVRKKIASKADERIKILEETINSILVIKMYCWERFSLKKINDKRKGLHAITEQKSYYADQR